MEIMELSAHQKIVRTVLRRLLQLEGLLCTLHSVAGRSCDDECLARLATVINIRIRKGMERTMNVMYTYVHFSSSRSERFSQTALARAAD